MRRVPTRRICREHRLTGVSGEIVIVNCQILTTSSASARVRLGVGVAVACGLWLWWLGFFGALFGRRISVSLYFRFSYCREGGNGVDLAGDLVQRQARVHAGVGIQWCLETLLCGSIRHCHGEVRAGNWAALHLQLFLFVHALHQRFLFLVLRVGQRLHERTEKCTRENQAGENEIGTSPSAERLKQECSKRCENESAEARAAHGDAGSQRSLLLEVVADADDSRQINHAEANAAHHTVGQHQHVHARTERWQHERRTGHDSPGDTNSATTEFVRQRGHDGALRSKSLLIGSIGARNGFSPAVKYIPLSKLPTHATLPGPSLKSATNSLRNTPKVYAIPSTTMLQRKLAITMTQPYPPSARGWSEEKINLEFIKICAKTLPGGGGSSL